MKTYDYLENVKEDVRNYIEENKIVVTSSNREEVEQDRKILKRYVFKSHDRWQECYSINKTSIRKNYSGVTEIVELKSK